MDTQGLIWCPLFLSYLWLSRDRALYTAMFPLALAIESYGTWMGGWSYHVREPWFGLCTITRPPVWTGTFYCTLDVLVVMTSRMPWTARVADLRAYSLALIVPKSATERASYSEKLTLIPNAHAKAYPPK